MFRSTARSTSRLGRGVATSVVVVFGLLAGLGAVAEPAQAQQRGGADCTRLERRADEIPGIRRRVRAQVGQLEARLAGVADPNRRVRLERRLQPRLERLLQLDERLGAYVVDVEQRCGPLTT